MRHATSATITDRGAAPPLNAMPAGMDRAVAIAGAMNVIDWNSTPPKPTAPRRRPVVPCSPDSGTAVVIGLLLRSGVTETPQSRTGASPPTTSGLYGNPDNQRRWRRDPHSRSVKSYDVPWVEEVSLRPSGDPVSGQALSPTLGTPHVDRQNGCPAGSAYTQQWSAWGWCSKRVAPAATTRRPVVSRSSTRNARCSCIPTSPSGQVGGR